MIGAKVGWYIGRGKFAGHRDSKVNWNVRFLSVSVEKPRDWLICILADRGVRSYLSLHRGAALQLWNGSDGCSPDFLGVRSTWGSTGMHTPDS
jgi:hypothetical protein